MERLKEFLFGAGAWAVASDAASFVFFVLSVVSAGKYGASLSAFVFLAISLPLFWIGAYSSFSKKANELDAEKVRNAKPEIVGRILFATIRFCGNSIDKGVITPNCVIAMKLSVTSKTNIDATLKDAELLVRMNGYEYPGQRLPLGIVDYSSTHGGAPEKMSDLISSTTYSNPIRYRVASVGWLEFMVNGADGTATTLHADIRVTLTDELDDKHIIIAEDVIVR